MAKLPGAIAGARIVGEHFVHSQQRQNPKNPEGRMPLMDHIRELRNRVVKIALALVAGMTAGFVFFNRAWDVIERPLCTTAIRGHSGCRTLGVNELVLNGPLDAFYLRVKVALIVGVILSSPIWLYQIWAFAVPGLHARTCARSPRAPRTTCGKDWARSSPTSTLTCDLQELEARGDSHESSNDRVPPHGNHLTTARRKYPVLTEGSAACHLSRSPSPRRTTPPPTGPS
jgi:hypothetical protein